MNKGKYLFFIGDDINYLLWSRCLTLSGCLKGIVQP